jgi:hypothetical protein
MKNLFVYCFFTFIVFLNITFLYSQEKPGIKLPHEELIKPILPHEIEEEDPSQSRVISNHYYTPEGFEISEYLHQNWDGEAWQNAQKYTYTFNSFGLPEEYLKQIWDGTIWVYVDIYFYTYNSNNLNSQILYQTWDGAVWLNSEMYLKSYGSNNLPTGYIYQTWDSTIWVNSVKTVYTYNSNDDYTEYLYQTWDGAVWVNEYRILFEYDSNHNNTTYTELNWNGTAWVNDYRYIYTYNSNNDYDVYAYQTWNGSTWINDSRWSFTYDSNTNLTLQLSETWMGGGWVNNYRYSYIYDSNNNRTVQTYQTWNGTGWDNSNRYVYTYKNGGSLLLTSLYQIRVGEVWQNNSLQTRSYDFMDLLSDITNQTWNGTTWVYESRIHHTWENVTDIDDEITELKDFKLFNNYPNPFNPSTVIKYSVPQQSFVKLTIYDALGKKVNEIISGIRDAGVYEENFNATGLSSGVYFYRIEAQSLDGKDNFISAKKMIFIK